MPRMGAAYVEGGGGRPLSAGFQLPTACRKGAPRYGSAPRRQGQRALHRGYVWVPPWSAGDRRARLLDALPDLRAAEEREPDEAADAEPRRAVERHLRAVGAAVGRVGDRAAGPLRAVRLHVAEDDDAAEIAALVLAGAGGADAALGKQFEDAAVELPALLVDLDVRLRLAVVVVDGAPDADGRLRE